MNLKIIMKHLVGIGIVFFSGWMYGENKAHKMYNLSYLEPERDILINIAKELYNYRPGAKKELKKNGKF